MNLKRVPLEKPKLIYTDRKQISGCIGQGERRNERVWKNIWGNESALHLDCDGGFMIYIKTQTAYFKYSLLYINHILIRLPF